MPLPFHGPARLGPHLANPGDLADGERRLRSMYGPRMLTAPAGRLDSLASKAAGVFSDLTSACRCVIVASRA